MHVLPVVALNLIVRPREVLVLLSEVQSRNQENENGEGERHEQSQHFVTHKDSIILVFGPEEGGANS